MTSINLNSEELYDITPCYLFSFSNDGLITRMNKLFLTDLGFAEKDVVNQRYISELLTVGSKIFFQTHFYPLIKLHGKGDEIYLSFRTADKGELPVLLNVKLYGNAEIFEIHCGGMKIENRNRFEKEILAAKQVAEKALLENEVLTSLKDQLEENFQALEKKMQQVSLNLKENQQVNNVVSHDLQEPLRKVCIFSNKLLTDPNLELDQNTRAYLEKINRSSVKMRELILSLQKYISLNSGSLKVALQPLAAIIQEAGIMAGISDSDNSILLRVNENPEMYGDAQLLGSLFVELMKNSLAFRKEDSTLEINISTDYIEQNFYKELEHKYKFEEYLRIVYTDNGIGFEDKYAGKIFGLFRKAHDVKNTLGIGLAYCRKILELHNGFISARSAPGGPTHFTMLIPRAYETVMGISKLPQP